MGSSPFDGRDITGHYLAYVVFYNLVVQWEFTNNLPIDASSLSEQMLAENCPIRKKRPTQLRAWLDQHGFQLSNDWLCRQDEVYLAVVVYYSQMAVSTGVNNVFYTDFRSTMITDGDGDRFPSFFYAAGDQAMATGTSIAAMKKGRNFYGHNLLGEAYDRLGQLLLSTRNEFFQFQSDYSLDRMRTVCIFPPRPVSKIVLCYTDSYGKYFNSFSSGEIVRKSGGCFDTVLEEAVNRDVSPDMFDNIIIWIEFNEVRRSKCAQKASIAKLKQMLQAEFARGRDPKTVLVVPALPFASIPGVAEHSQLLKEELDPLGVHFLDWNMYVCPFLDAHGKPVERFFDKKPNGEVDIHLNRDGVHYMWSMWCPLLPDLRYVKYSLAKVPYLSEADEREHQTRQRQRAVERLRRSRQQADNRRSDDHRASTSRHRSRSPRQLPSTSSQRHHSGYQQSSRYCSRR